MNIVALKKLLWNGDASEIAEAALVLPIAFMVLLGIYWFGRAFNTYATINHAAREGARVAVAQTCGNCGNAVPSSATVAGVVTQTLQASSVDPSQIKSYTPTVTSCPTAASACSATNNITLCTNVKLETSPSNGGPPACGVVVSFQYPYQFWLPFTSLNNQRLILTADVQMAGEY
jgi:Flp pilus assembly protein TadG